MTSSTPGNRSTPTASPPVPHCLQRCLPRSPIQVRSRWGDVGVSTAQSNVGSLSFSVGASSWPVGLDAGGIPACSRWLSAATPPVPGFRRLASRQGCQPRQDADPTPFAVPRRGCLDGAGTPPGCRKISGRGIPVVSLRSNPGCWLGSLRDRAGLPRRGCGPAGCTTQHQGPDQGSARSPLQPPSTQQPTENDEGPQRVD